MRSVLSIDPDQEVAKNVLVPLEVVVELVCALGRQREARQVIDRLAEMFDWVRQPASPPGFERLDLPVTRGDVRAHPLDNLLSGLFGEIDGQHKHELVRARFGSSRSHYGAEYSIRRPASGLVDRPHHAWQEQSAGSGIVGANSGARVPTARF